MPVHTKASSLPAFNIGLPPSTSRRQRTIKIKQALELDPFPITTTTKLRSRSISGVESTTSTTATTPSTTTAIPSTTIASAMANTSWHVWKVYLHEGVFRTNVAARKLLLTRIRRVGSKVETCYSVGVTHVVTVSADEPFDDTSQILRGAVMRSGFLRSTSRRSKDLLLKAAQKRTTTPTGSRSATPKKEHQQQHQQQPDGHNPIVVTANTFMGWLTRREQVLGLSSSSSSYPAPPTNNRRTSTSDSKMNGKITRN